MEIHFSPMQGYVDNAYRRLHADIYGAIDSYYTPFIRMEKGQPRRQDMSRLEASVGDGTPLVPQIIFGSVDEFHTLSDAIKSVGCKRIDINLGCPYPMQTHKGRGAAMICDQTTMSEIVKIISEDTHTSYSVKMRIGYTSADDWTMLLPILNSCELEHIAVHPRIAAQMYKGELDETEFSRFLDLSSNPVLWNGEIRSMQDIDTVINRHPKIKGVMIGRGLLARPSLAAEWRSGKEWDADRRHAQILNMHALLLEQYEATLCGATQILQKIKPYWEYLEQQIDHKSFKAIRKATTLEKYKSAVDALNFIPN